MRRKNGKKRKNNAASCYVNVDEESRGTKRQDKVKKFEMAVLSPVVP